MDYTKTLKPFTRPNFSTDLPTVVTTAIANESI